MMILSESVLQAGELVGTVNIIILMTVQIQIHRLSLVAARWDVEVGGIEFQMLEVIYGVAWLLDVRGKGRRQRRWQRMWLVVCVADWRTR